MKKILLSGVFALSTILAGCGGGYYGGGYYSRYGPPAPRYESYGAAPGAGYVWTNGYWDRGGGGDWRWRSGRWERPPRGRSAWVPHEWRNEGGRYRFYRGHWR